MDPLAEVRSVLLLLRTSVYPKRRGAGGAVRFPEHWQQPNSAGPKLQPQPSLPFAAWNTSTAGMNSLKEGDEKEKGMPFSYHFTDAGLLTFPQLLMSCQRTRRFGRS